MLNTMVDVTAFSSPWSMEPFRHRLIGELWMRSMTAPAFRLLMRLQGIGDYSSVSKAELNAHLALVKGPDHGRAFLRIMRSTERTPAKQARYRAAVGNVPYPVQAVWGADDPAMTLAEYGERARAAADLSQVHTVPGQHCRPSQPAASRSRANSAARAAAFQWALSPLGLGSTHRRAPPRVSSAGPTVALGRPNAVR